MFHDFEQYSQGCGGSEVLAAGEAAFAAAASFLIHPPNFAKLIGCSAASGESQTQQEHGCDYAPVAWITNFTKRPPIDIEQCKF
eukprot:SAG31_NODE_10330_length_1153_cov_1.218216_2_plen_84_part_00